MKSSALPQMKLNPSLSPNEVGFHRRRRFHPTKVGFIPSARTDLIEKPTSRNLSVFLVGDDGFAFSAEKAGRGSGCAYAHPFTTAPIIVFLARRCRAVDLSTSNNHFDCLTDTYCNNIKNRNAIFSKSLIWSRNIVPMLMIVISSILFAKNNKRLANANRLLLVGDDGFEPSKLKATDLQSAPFGRSGNLPYSVLNTIDGAGGRTRTPDLLITNQLLYQLSYTSTFGACI